MADVRFYHLQRSSIEGALLMLLEKSLEAGKRAVVRFASDEEMSAMDAALWTVKPDSFLPHGTTASKKADDQPVLLTAGHDNPNKAEFAFVLPGATGDALDYYERVFFVFYGNSESQVKEARGRWKDLTGEGLTPEYWTQDDAGGWTKKQ